MGIRRWQASPRRYGCARTPPIPPRDSSAPPEGTKQLLDGLGAERFAQWTLDQKRLLLTDTTFRDAHQSLLATRVLQLRHALAIARFRLAPFTQSLQPGDVGQGYVRRCDAFPARGSFRSIAAAATGDPQHLFPNAAARASNAVGYTAYPDNVVDEFIREAAERPNGYLPHLRFAQLRCLT